MKKTILIFGLLVFALLLLFQISKYALVRGDLTVEIVIAAVALVFFIIAVYLNKKSLHKPAAAATVIDHQKIKELQLSKREYQVLQAIAAGLSNKEIAAQLFVSESTIKTHVSSVLIKLDAKRRTQAVQIAKQLQIL